MRDSWFPIFDPVWSNTPIKTRTPTPPRNKHGQWNVTETEVIAGLVTVCPKCTAYVQDATKHKRWHKKIRKQRIRVISGPADPMGPMEAST